MSCELLPYFQAVRAGDMHFHINVYHAHSTAAVLPTGSSYGKKRGCYT